MTSLSLTHLSTGPVSERVLPPRSPPALPSCSSPTRAPSTARTHVTISSFLLHTHPCLVSLDPSLKVCNSVILFWSDEPALFSLAAVGLLSWSFLTPSLLFQVTALFTRVSCAFFFPLKPADTVVAFSGAGGTLFQVRANTAPWTSAFIFPVTVFWQRLVGKGAGTLHPCPF